MMPHLPLARIRPDHIGRSRHGIPGSLKKFLRFDEHQGAAELGATNTHFTNPHGYHDENHYTSAYDLALITREAMKHENLQGDHSASPGRLSRLE